VRVPKRIIRVPEGRRPAAKTSTQNIARDPAALAPWTLLSSSSLQRPCSPTLPVLGACFEAAAREGEGRRHLCLVFVLDSRFVTPHPQLPLTHYPLERPSHLQPQLSLSFMGEGSKRVEGIDEEGSKTIDRNSRTWGSPPGNVPGDPFVATRL
jgi:hypothetical protein